MTDGSELVFAPGNRHPCAMRNSCHWVVALSGLAAMFLSSHSLAGDAIELDQKFNDPLSMEKYGGLHKDLIVQETDQDGIRYSIVDYTRMIWRSQLTGQLLPDGSTIPRDSTFVQVPTVIERKRKKSDPDNGSSRIDGLYLLYDEPSTGLKIYFKDTLATPADAVRLKIIPGS
jgi:hypothetical protein